MEETAARLRGFAFENNWLRRWAPCANPSVNHMGSQNYPKLEDVEDVVRRPGTDTLVVREYESTH